MYVLNREQTRDIEMNAVKEGESLLRLMSNAGSAVYKFIIENLGTYSKNIVILAGKGNNGGDGFVIANKLLDDGYNVSVILLAGEPKTDISKFFYRALMKKQAKILGYGANNKENDKIFDLIRDATLIVDAVYGIGFSGSVRLEIASIFRFINNLECKVLAVDVPSGLDCDSQEIDKNCIHADYTITFSTLKPVNVLYPGSEYCGEVHVKSVGISEDIIKNSEHVMEAINKEMVKKDIKPRGKNTNKGSFGRAFCICGSVGMAGAAILSGNACLRSGAGYTEMAVVEGIYNIVSGRLPEAVFTLLDQNTSGHISTNNLSLIKNRLKFAQSCLIGCGLGQYEGIERIISTVLENKNTPVVADADALNVISKNIRLLGTAGNSLIITPHPGEMARLMDTTVESIQNNRIYYAKELAKRYGIIVVLKGANTIISDEKGNIFVNTNGNPGMAKAGSGDVLSGIIVALLAQGFSPISATICGVYIHGQSGDLCAKRYSQTAMKAGDIITELSNVFLDLES